MLLTNSDSLRSQLMRNFTGVLIADLAITNLTISLRAVANLRYGTTLRSTRQIYISSGPPSYTSSSAKLVTRGRAEPRTLVGAESVVKHPDTIMLGDVSADDTDYHPDKSPGTLSQGRSAVNLAGAMV